jgi:hypothetical protein
LWTIGTPGLHDRAGNLKGADFLHLYTLGILALGHRGADLYHVQAQSTLAAQRIPGVADIHYLPLYPPQVSLFFAPFAHFSYATALLAWLLLSGIIYLLCCSAIWRTCPNLRTEKWTIVILALAFPAFWHLIVWGQTSALALACFTLAFLALRGQKEFLAGLALGCLIFKPQLGLAAALLFLFTFRWRIIAGAILAAGLQLFTAASYYGVEPLYDWLGALRAVPQELPLLEPRPYQTHCLRTFWTMLIPRVQISFALYAVSAGIVVVLLIACWHKNSALPLFLRYSALLLATVLLSPHLTVYDLVILAPAFLLLGGWIAGHPRENSRPLPLLLYLAFILPLLGPFARRTHLQLSVPAMAALLFWIWKSGTRSAPATSRAGAASRTVQEL